MGLQLVSTAEYRNMAITILPQLSYLDYTMITEQERKEAGDLHLVSKQQCFVDNDGVITATAAA